MNINFNEDQQHIFSLLSNDYNPIHLDKKYTYKTSFDKPIIYGILLVLKSLDNLKLTTRNRIDYLHVEFLNYININDNIQIVYENNLINILKNDNILCSVINYELSVDNSSNYILENYDNNIKKYKDNNIPEKDYILELNIKLDILEKYFNNIFNNFNLLQILQIINLSTFVGMISPGLN